MQVLTVRPCKISRGGELLFDPAWGDFDLAVGSSITSVFGGAADREAYGESEDFAAKRVPKKKADAETLSRYSLFQQIRDARVQHQSGAWQPLTEQLLQNYKLPWLIGMELLELAIQKPGVQSGFVNMPTAAQRAGNFAGYSDGNGVLSNLTDPSTGLAVPNNNVAPLVLDSAAAKVGQAMLNSFPLPNICGNSGVAATGCFQSPTFASTQYQQNYFWTFNETHPRRNDTARVDYNLTSKLTSWVRYTNDYDQDTTGSVPEKNRPVISPR